MGIQYDCVHLVLCRLVKEYHMLTSKESFKCFSVIPERESIHAFQYFVSPTVLIATFQLMEMLVPTAPIWSIIVKF